MSLPDVRDYVKQQFKLQKITYVRIYSNKPKNKMLESVKFYQTNILPKNVEKIVKELNRGNPDKNYYITSKVDPTYFWEASTSIFIKKLKS